MKIEKFEDIIAWKKAKELVLIIYTEFKDCKNWGFKDQIQRASLSIMNNIAEGFERRGDKELTHFLFIAKGSCAEVRSMIFIAQELNYLPKDQSRKIYNLSNEISKIISGFIKSLNR